MDSTAIYDKVQEHYSSIVKGNKTDNKRQIAQALGYAADDLDNIPADANLGVSCGNPLAIATLAEGETVVDLGSGAGFDVFLAARKIGSQGLSIGIDQNDDMLAKANENKRKCGLSNVRFVKSRISNIDLPSNTTDCVISNCVVNLVPEVERPHVFKESFRVLKPGGRIALSDILAKKELPERVRQDMSMWVGCIAGASLVQQYETYLREAGFVNIKILDSGSSVNVCCSSAPSQSRCSKDGTKTSSGGQDSASADTDFDEWAGSYQVFATKPSSQD